MEIQELTVAEEKQKVVRQILEGLPEWFGIAEAREEYIAQSAGQPCFAAMEQGKPIGFLCLKETGRDTMELAVMGVDRKYHCRGCGRALFAAAKKYAAQTGYSFLQVKQCRWGATKNMMTPTVFTRVWGSRSWKYSQAFGMSGTHARFTLWQFSERKRKLVAAKNDAVPLYLAGQKNSTK